MKVELTGYETKAVTVEFYPEQVIDAVIRLVYQTGPLREGQWVSNGKVWEEVHTSHSWDNDIRKATKEDEKTYALIRSLHELKSKV